MQYTLWNDDDENVYFTRVSKVCPLFPIRIYYYIL